MENRSNYSSINDSQSIFSPKYRQGLKRPLESPVSRKTISRSSISIKGSTQIICKTNNHLLECYDSPVPVLITEVITFAERTISAKISAQISEIGYAWVIVGRRLLIWQYKQSTLSNSIVLPCYELALPASDLVHKANLCCLIANNESNNQGLPSCIAVSPEGIVRYWPSISHEGSFIEQNIELNGQECDSITYVNNIGCILATTTCSIILLQPMNRRTINVKILKPPSGWLGGISRRLSSFIFGPTNTASNETRLVKVTTSFESNKWHIYVLAGQNIQKWHFDNNDTSKNNEQLQYEFNIGRVIKNLYKSNLWSYDNNSVSGMIDINGEIDIWMLDMEVFKNKLIFFIAAYNKQRSATIHYAIASMKIRVPTQNEDILEIFDTFNIIKINELYSEERESELLSYRLLINQAGTFIYNANSIYALGYLFGGLYDEPDRVQISTNNDRILGGNICKNIPLFFTKNHGLVTISQLDFPNSDFMNNSTAMSESSFFDQNITDQQIDLASNNLTLYELDPHDIILFHSDSLFDNLKQAFLYFIKKNNHECFNILNNKFPITDLNDIDSPLDKTVIKISEDLINDMPAGDPRWMSQKAYSANIGSSTSMQIIAQLQDKQIALKLFINFLKETKLWDRLSRVTFRGTDMLTIHILCEHYEKIVAAITMKTLFNKYNNLMEKAIEQTLEKDNTINKDCGTLTLQDLFFRKIDNVHTLINQLNNICQKQCVDDSSPMELSKLLENANTIILQILKDVEIFREKVSPSIFKITTSISKLQYEYINWFVAVGNKGIYDSLMNQQQLTLKYGARMCTINIDPSNQASVKFNFYEQLGDYIDILLKNKLLHLNSICGQDKYHPMLHQFENDRYSLLRPLVEDKEYELADALAEKYKDFDILIELCELMNDQQRLNQLIEKYENEFSDHMFNWYLRNNKPASLLTKTKSMIKKNHLNKLIDKNLEFGWIQNISDENFSEASDKLFVLAKNEIESVIRKKRQLSLAKLTQLASQNTDTDIIENINSDLELIAHQLDLPDVIITDYNLDKDNPRVMTAPELIQLYLSMETEDKNIADYKKALELLNYVEDDFERNDLRHKIWCSSILQDITWQKLDKNLPLESILETNFFKLINVSIIIDKQSLDEILPPIESIVNANELKKLPINEEELEFYLKIGYEYLYQNFNE